MKILRINSLPWPHRLQFCLGCVFTLFLIMLTGPVSTAALAGQENSPAPMTISDDLRCPVCGMYPAKFEKWQSQVVFKNGDIRAFAACKDLYKYLLDMGKYEKEISAADIAVIYVKDFSDGAWVNGKAAHYVSASNVMGPMGKDLIPFADIVQATEFAKSNGGHIVNHSQVDMKLIHSLGMMKKDGMHKHQTQ
jgi:copper chaperone NosL